MNQEEIKKILAGVIHPEYQKDVVSLGMADEVGVSGDEVSVTLKTLKPRDPLVNSVRKAVIAAIAAAFPQSEGHISVIVREPAANAKEKPAAPGKFDDPKIGHVIAVASGKGGVGKSTVTSNLALALTGAGYKVGVLDADLYGPSAPKMFGAEGAIPEAIRVDGKEMIVPIERHGVKVMSIGFFIRPDDALIWRGPMANNALQQLIRQTLWGELDFLLIDLPPGTGDIHLTILQTMAVDGAVIVSTPQQVAIADVVRGIGLFRSTDVPVLGLVENMAWFTPAELPENKYYIFGKGGAAALAREQGIPLLGQIPLVQGICEGGDNGTPAIKTDPVSRQAFSALAKKVAEAAEVAEGQ